MIIDMHVHTEKSSDSSATVDQYCGIIQKYSRYYPFDGLVLTEHRLYDVDGNYQEIGEKYEILILQGIEIDADLGHLLLYGITNSFLKKIDISSRGLESERVIKTINDCGGIAIPAHPFRESSYGSALAENDKALDEIEVIEELNGVNSTDQNEKARELVERNGLKGTGGSDAHYANHHWFLNSATEFRNPVHTMEDLVKELRYGEFRAIALDNSVLGEF